MLRLPSLLQPEPLSLWQVTADLCLHRRHSNTQSGVWLSLLWGSLLFFLSPSAHKVLFVPSKSLWPVWGMMLNAMFPLLQSCWGFSFALDVGYLLQQAGVGVESNIFLWMAVQQLVVILVFSQEMSTDPSTLPSLFLVPCFWLIINQRFPWHPTWVKFARMAHNSEKTFYLLDYRFITKSYNLGIARWKECKGKIMGKGLRTSMSSPNMPLSPELHLFTTMKNLHTMSFGSYGGFIMQG